jgi:hypothetical protein
MKKLFLGLALAAPLMLSAQNFEGVIKFSMEYKGDNAAQLTQMAPSANVVTIKGNNAKVVMEGGMMASMVGDVINKGDEKTTYFVQASSKTVYKVKSEEADKNKGEDDAVVTKENGTAKILGYTCQKYKVVTKSGTNYVWASKDVNMGNADFRGKVQYKGVEGMVLKQEMNVSQEGQNMTIIMTCVQLDKKTVNDSEFAIPADYTVKEELPMILKMQQGQ